jgi:hypothetical protein
MTNPTPEQVDAAMRYAKGCWLYEDLKPLYGPGTTYDQIPREACKVLATAVERLRQEAVTPRNYGAACYCCEITEDRLAQTLKALRQLVHEVHAAHKGGLPVAPYCADMLTAIQLLSSIKSPTSES